ncbi:hypothetical protein [uncultured Bacteroides sp.]|jgi:hypothetical protein|uniref:hypothetical protein n=1 Tax=uncultured Bacteroides sp. TaxID=162156 RepID=UPI0026187285|nr:hypothetical protein [uncultured Bacteroides sp.]
MNRIFLFLKRPFIWMLRFRHRCGYGVHSPFAFNLITQVIYESTPYYKYKDLEKEEKKLALEKDKNWKYESKKRKHLLFRLVNYTQPNTIVDIGRLAASSLYLKAGREGADYVAASSLSELFLEADVPVDFLYLHHYRQPKLMEEAFHLCLARITDQSIFVIEGIRYTPEMFALWKRMRQDEKAGVSFDLYDLGILFFDKTKIKQDYVVNF